MVRIPSGTFLMGSNDGKSNEKPVHEVTVHAFDIDVTEVTVDAYRQCQCAGFCSEPRSGEECNWRQSDRGKHPINCVDWHQAQSYCVHVGKSLPTEEQWEYAARGTDGRRFPWKNGAPGGQACWSGKGNDLGLGERRSTCAVGSYPAGDSPFGAHDMAGNVWEWTDSGYSENYGKPREEYRFVLRGGGWDFGNPSDLRAASRHGFEYSMRLSNIGFRCARQDALTND
jgi:formylglycine-generating enzyme required for sulfatase activity